MADDIPSGAPAPLGGPANLAVLGTFDLQPLFCTQARRIWPCPQVAPPPAVQSIGCTKNTHLHHLTCFSSKLNYLLKFWR